MVSAEDIICVLAQSGENGMKLGKLATHVYNSHNTFFESPDYDVVYAEVQQMVLRLSKSSSSVIEQAPLRGYYRINPDKLSLYGQLTIDFDALVAPQPEEEEEEPESPAVDLSLNLFGDEF